MGQGGCEVKERLPRDREGSGKNSPGGEKYGQSGAERKRYFSLKEKHEGAGAREAGNGGLQAGRAKTVTNSKYQKNTFREFL